MANWISSKLKAAETILQQIDQQAADSLRKNEKSQLHDEVFETPTRTGSSVSLKDQLKKKTSSGNDYGSGSQRNSFERTPSNTSSSKIFSNQNQHRERTNSTSESLTQQKPSLTDSDWTELLSSPNWGTNTSGARSANGASVIRGLKKDGRRQGNLGSNVLALDRKRSEKKSGNVLESKGKLDKQLNGKRSDGEESSSSGRSSGVEMRTDFKKFDGGKVENKNATHSTLIKSTCQDSEKDVKNVKWVPPHVDSTRSANNTLPQESSLDTGKDDGRGTMRNTVWGKQVTEETLQNTVSHDPKRKDSSLLSDETDSDSESGSSTDSERERAREERRRTKEKIFSEKVAAKAVEAVKERENMVARLEGEKQTLEKILEERAKQQEQEASELQTTMMQTMEAVEVEKQKHNNTRMEVLARLAGLETANADLARSLATAQKKLETEIDQVAELREKFEGKESALEELKRRISSIHQSGKYLDQLASSKGVEFEHQMLEAECSLLTDKIARLQEKANKLEADIEMVRKDIEEPTEVEVELTRRLDQLTDHLIQKQSQVEALSSEKATLLFRIEAISRLLEENNSLSMAEASSSRDVESGEWEVSESKLRPIFREKFQMGKKHLGSMVRQLNAIFVSGAVFLKRNPAAKLWSAVYLLGLHMWVLYILLSHSEASASHSNSGAAVSLEKRQ